MSRTVRARVDDTYAEKFESLSAALGLSPSQLLRTLIDAAEIVSKPAVKISLAKKNSSNTELFQGNGAAAATVQ